MGRRAAKRRTASGAERAEEKKDKDELISAYKASNHALETTSTARSALQDPLKEQGNNILA
jgi:hypothetical protein